MSRSNARFKSCISNDDMPISTMFFKMSMYINDPNFDNYCVVEGRTDEHFYKHLPVSPFADSKTAFIYKDYEPKSSVAGKSAVIYAFKRFLVKFPSNMKNTMFIVDHDYDGLDYKKYGIADKYRKLIVVLPVYSFENYFLSRENIMITLSTLGYSQDIAKSIHSRLMDIKEETLEYHICKYIIINKANDPKYRNLSRINYKYNEDHMFSIDSASGKLRNIENLFYEICSMKTEIFNYPELQILYDTIRESMTNDSDNRLIKGKLLLGVLNDLLCSHKSSCITYKNHYLYAEIVSSLKIEFTPIFADIEEE